MLNRFIIYISLVLVFILSGCSDEKVKSITPVIIYKEIMSVELNDERIINLLSEIVANYGNQEGTLLNEPIYKILLNNKTYYIHSNGVNDGTSIYLPEEPKISDLLSFLSLSFSENVKKLVVHTDRINSPKVSFKDVNEEKTLTIDDVNLILSKLQSGTTSADPHFGQVPFPYLEVQLIKDELSIIWLSPDTAQLKIGNQIQWINFSDDLLWNKFLNENNVRKNGLYLLNQSLVTFRGSVLEVSNKFNRLDSLIRLLKIETPPIPTPSPNTLNEDSKIIVSFDKEGKEEVFVIYENDVILYGGKFFKQDSVYDNLIAFFEAG
jgi:hypothetical protein